MKQSSLRQKYFGNWAFYKMALLVAVPMMIQNAITNFVSLLDNIMVGQVGTVQMTGVAISNQLIFVFNLAIFGAVSGAGIFGAQFFGSGDREGVRHAFRFKVYICALLFAVAVVIFTLWGEDLILLYLKGEGEVENIQASLHYAKEYLHIIMVGLLPYTIAQCYAGTLRECGKTVAPMVAGIASVAVNLGLNAVLIFGYLGAPAMGSAGAAWATVISRFVELGVVAAYAHLSAEGKSIFAGIFRKLGMPRRLFFDILKKSFPLLMNETLWSGGMAMLAQCYSLHGYDVVSAYNISSAISNVFTVSFTAMGSAIGIIVGQILGANKVEEAKDTDRKLIVFTMIMCTGLGLLIAAAAPLLTGIYDKSSPEILALATFFLRTVSLFTPAHALANACYFTLRSGGKTFVTFLFDSFYVCVLVLPLANILSHWTSVNIYWIYIICQLTEVGKCMVGLFMLKKGVWIQNIVKGETV
jgi:putative MATE family efflux protein